MEAHPVSDTTTPSAAEVIRAHVVVWDRSPEGDRPDIVQNAPTLHAALEQAVIAVGRV